MANMSMTKNPIPQQEPLVRNKNFDEVALGYTEEIAIDEAMKRLRTYSEQEKEATREFNCRLMEGAEHA